MTPNIGYYKYKEMKYWLFEEGDNTPKPRNYFSQDVLESLDKWIELGYKVFYTKGDKE